MRIDFGDRLFCGDWKAGIGLFFFVVGIEKLGSTSFLGSGARDRDRVGVGRSPIEVPNFVSHN